MENTLSLLKELAGDPKMMWVVGGGSVVSENHAAGIQEPEVHNGWATIEAENWHFHLQLEQIDGIQFVEAMSHGNLKSYYVRFSRNWEETLVRCYFPNPYLDDDEKRTDMQPDKLQAFEEARDRWVGQEENLVFVQR
jgi:putative heme iron utilization protein